MPDCVDRIVAPPACSSNAGGNLALRLDDPVIDVLPADGLVLVSSVALGQLLQSRLDGSNFIRKAGCLVSLVTGLTLVGSKRPSTTASAA